jgi:glucokinase
MYYIGIDLGGTNIAAGVVDGNTGKIISKASVPTNAQREPDEIVKDMAKLCLKITEDAKLTINDIEYAGIATPGSVDVETGMVIYTNNIPFYMYPIADKLTEFSGIKKIYVDNDANAATKGEVEYGAAKGYKDVIMITLGTGVGGGIVLNGKLHSGFNGAGGELGHTVISVGGLECTCGRKGCWEVYSSATGLINMTKRALEGKTKDETIMLDMVEKDGKVSGRTAFDAMRKGDNLAKKVVDEYIFYLAEGLANMVNIFQPQVVVIGGGISNEKETLLAPLRELVNKADYNKLENLKTQLKIAELGNDAGIIGAATLGI